MCSELWKGFSRQRKSAAFQRQRCFVSLLYSSVVHYKAMAVLDSWKDNLFFPIFSSSGRNQALSSFIPDLVKTARKSITVKPYMSCSSALRQILGLRSSRQTKQHQHVDVCWHRAAASFLHSWDIAAHCSSQGRCGDRRSKLAAGFSVWRSYWPWLDYSSAHSAVARGTDTHYIRKSKICAYRYG